MSIPIKVRKAPTGKFRQQIQVGENFLFADVDEKSGGENSAPDPHALLDAALGACTALTVTLVARHKQWPLTDVQVEITHQEADGVYHLRRNIELIGELSVEQRGYLLGIANKCPIHKALTGRFEIDTVLL